jgi:ribosomal protein S27E
MPTKRSCSSNLFKNFENALHKAQSITSEQSEIRHLIVELSLNRRIEPKQQESLRKLCSMQCPSCGSRDIDFDEAGGHSACVNCGTVVEENSLTSSIEFQVKLLNLDVSYNLRDMK